MNPFESLQRWSEDWSRFKASPVEESEPVLTTGLTDGTETSTSIHSIGSGDVADMLFEDLTGGLTPTVKEMAAPAGESFQISDAAGVWRRTNVFPGLIVHLPRSCHGRNGRSVYGLVLSVSDHGQVEVAPFGLLELAALPTELNTDLVDRALQVLCLWNVGWLPVEVVEESWPLQADGAQLRRELLELRGALARKEPLPEHLADRVGPPLVHPEDPRQEYVSQEEMLWQI